MRKHSLQQL